MGGFTQNTGFNYTSSISMTTAQRDALVSPKAGLIIFNTTVNKHQGFDGTIWNDFY